MSWDDPFRKADDVRFTYAEAMTDFRFYVPLAKAAEAAGYDAMTIADSIAYPFESDSKYPYTPDGNREFLDGKEFIETFVLTSALGRSPRSCGSISSSSSCPSGHRRWWPSKLGRSPR